jgi:hypothetical protein
MQQQQGIRHPGHSGLNSALRDDGGPLNALGGIPTVASDFSSLWDMNLGMWTPQAVDAGLPTRAASWRNFRFWALRSVDSSPVPTANLLSLLATL